MFSDIDRAIMRLFLLTARQVQERPTPWRVTNTNRSMTQNHLKLFSSKEITKV